MLAAPADVIATDRLVHRCACGVNLARAHCAKCLTLEGRCPPVEIGDTVTDERWPDQRLMVTSPAGPDWWNVPSTHRRITSLVRNRVLIYERPGAPPRRPEWHVAVAPHLRRVESAS